jgi:hypothetical protein
MGDVTRILVDIERGDRQAAAELLPRVCDELRRFAAAAEAMRRILIDRARVPGRIKRDGGCRRLQLDFGARLAEPSGDEHLDLDETLTVLAAKDLAAALVQLCVFGLTLVQAAEPLGVSWRTADRDWTYARAWPCEALSGSGHRESSTIWIPLADRGPGRSISAWTDFGGISSPAVTELSDGWGQTGRPDRRGAL